MTTFNIVSGETASGLVLNSGDVMNVFEGGTVIDTTINSGAVENVSSGGVARGTFVSSSGLESISSGGVASGTTISSGGEQQIAAGGIASGATVANLGTQDVSGSRPSSIWLLTSRQPKCLVSMFRLRCSPAPTRSSNETARVHRGAWWSGGVTGGGNRTAEK